MTRFFKASLTLVAFLSLAAASGCGKKDNPTQPQPTGGGATPADTTVAANLTATTVSVLGFTKGFDGGLANPDLSDITKGAQNPPDTSWHPNITHASYFKTPAVPDWYQKTIYRSGATANIWVLFTGGDPWGNPASYAVYRFDYDMSTAILYGGRTYTMTMAAYLAYAGGTDTIHYNGGLHFSGPLYDTTASWTFNFSNVSRYGWTGNPRICSGAFTYSGYGGKATGSLTFTNGTGTGTAKYNNVAIATYLFRNDGTGTCTVGAKTHDFTW